jgi:hypothetical protein
MGIGVQRRVSVVTGATIAHSRSDFDQAKTCWRWWLVVQGVAPVLGVIAALVPDWKGVAVAAPLFTVVLGLVALHFRAEAEQHFENGERIRRTDLLCVGLGIEPPAEEIARQLTDTSAEPSPELALKSPYYNSQLGHGPRRLAHIVAESAHFTDALAKHTAKLCAKVAIVGATFVLLVLLAVLALIPKTAAPPGSGASLLQQNASGIASACIAMGSFFALGTLIELWRSFGSLSRIAEATRTRCMALLHQRSLALHDVLFALEPYNCALAKSAPIPSFIWEKHKDRLTASWAAASKAITA